MRTHPRPAGGNGFSAAYVGGLALGPTVERVGERLIRMLPVARDEIELVLASMVLLGVLVHGVTASPLSAVYARRVRGIAAYAPEKRGTFESPTRGGCVPPSIRRGG